MVASAGGSRSLRRYDEPFDDGVPSLFDPCRFGCVSYAHGRMAKSDLQARPVYHRTRDSIEAHLTIVFAALAVSRWIEHQTGWSIKKFVRTARRYAPSRSKLENRR